MKIKVKFHHDNSGHCQTTFVTVDAERRRFFNRMDGAGWHTVYPSQGYWESSAPVRDNVVFVVVDGDGNTLFEESNANLGAFQSIYSRARQMSKEWAKKLHLRPYEDWKRWLVSDMEARGYTDYIENWLYAESRTTGSEQVGSYEHLGMDFCIEVEQNAHKICGKEWRDVYIRNETNGNTEALCGFIFEEVE